MEKIETWQAPEQHGSIALTEVDEEIGFPRRFGEKSCIDLLSVEAGERTYVETDSAGCHDQIGAERPIAEGSLLISTRN